jgi:putative hydrolase of the HAD superfamily
VLEVSHFSLTKRGMTTGREQEAAVLPTPAEDATTRTRGPYGICWDLGDVIFSEDTEVKSPEGLTLEVVLIPGIGDLLRSLAERGIPMAIVSDTRDGACENVLDPHGLKTYFAHWTISELLGVEKPHEAMFVTTSEALGIPLSRLAMVGNHYYRDIEGAKRVGMTTFWFRWNHRYPYPDEAPAADYIVSDASELAAAIDDWISSVEALRPSGRPRQAPRSLAP